MYSLHNIEHEAVNIPCWVFRAWFAAEDVWSGELDPWIVTLLNPTINASKSPARRKGAHCQLHFIPPFTTPPSLMGSCAGLLAPMLLLKGASGIKRVVGSSSIVSSSGFCPRYSHAIAFQWFCARVSWRGKWLVLITQSTGPNDHQLGKSLQAHKAIPKDQSCDVNILGSLIFVWRILLCVAEWDSLYCLALLEENASS
jgi:hypothetical protein